MVETNLKHTNNPQRKLGVFIYKKMWFGTSTDPILCGSMGGAKQYQSRDDRWIHGKIPLTNY